VLQKNTHTRTRTHTHQFNGPLSGTTRVSRYQKRQKGKTNLDSTEATDSEWQWHQLGHMQVCTSLQTDNHASTPPLSFYRPDALPADQATASKHLKQCYTVLFCSLAVLDPRVGHTMNVLSPFIPVLCHSDSLFHGESCPRAVRGLPRLRAPGIVPCIITFSRQLPCFLIV